MNMPGFDRPVFIARMLQNEVKYINGYPSFDGVIIDANLANHFGNPWKKVLEKRQRGEIQFLMVDPNTAKMEHRLCVEKPTYQKLSYCPESDPLTADDFRGESGQAFAENFSSNVIDTQIELGADILLTPYFVAKTIHSPWYSVNLDLVHKSVDAKVELAPEMPIYATICLSIAEITKPESIQAIVQDYSNCDVDGYYILAEGLSDRSSGSIELAALLHLIKKLSEKRKPVLVGYIDGFGMFTTAFGAAGFSAGICWLESFNESNFTLELEGRNVDAMRERFIYIPETFIKFPRDRAQLIYSNVDGLTSNQNSAFYSQKTLDWNDRARLFFLEKRYEELMALSDFSKEQMIEQLRNRLNGAIEFSEEIYNQDIKIGYSHLERWREAINSASLL